MMRWVLFLYLLFGAAWAHAQSAIDPNEGLMIESGTAEGEMVVKWFGKTGRSYFVQTSESLMPGDWTYVPVVEAGTAAVLQWGLIMTSERAFVRLRYTDQAYTGPVGDADFDTDGLTNNEELQLHQTDPLEGDSDGDALSDSQEVALGTNPNRTDSDGDGVSDSLELAQGSDPADGNSTINPEKYITSHKWLSAQKDIWDCYKIVDDPEEPVWRIFRDTYINGLNIYDAVLTNSETRDTISLTPYAEPTVWPTYYFDNVNTNPLVPTCYALRYGYSDDDGEQQEWRADGVRVKLQTTTPLENDYTIKYDLVRKRAPAGTQLPFVNVTLSTMELTLAKDAFESNEIKLVYPPEPNYNDQYVLVPQAEANVHRISFSGDHYLELKSDNGEVTYKAPHWFDRDQDDTADIEPFSMVESSAVKPERNRPVAFVAGTKPKLSGKFRARGFGLSGYSMYVRATINGSLHLPQTGCQYTSDGYVTLQPTETEEALPDEIAFFNAQGDNAFEIEWEFRTIGSLYGIPATWKPMGTTKHTVYVVKAAPISTADELRRETLFNIGCRMANGMSASASEADIVNAIYGEFTNDHTVARVQRSSGSLQGSSMTYWAGNIGGTNSTYSLLLSGNGQCGSWARFMIDILRTQGIDATLIEVKPPAFTESELQSLLNAYVSTLQLQGSATIDEINPSFWVKNSLSTPIPPPDAVGYVVNDPVGGVPSQGNPNPRKGFRDHALVNFGSRLYDPSYGTASVTDIDEWEQASLDVVGGDVIWHEVQFNQGNLIHQPQRLNQYMLERSSAHPVTAAPSAY